MEACELIFFVSKKKSVKSTKVHYSFIWYVDSLLLNTYCDFSFFQY